MVTLLAAAILSPVSVSGWVVFWDGGASVRSFEQNVESVREACVEWVRADANGLPVRRQQTDPESVKRFFAVARKNKVPLYVMTSNFQAPGGFQPGAVQAFLASEDKMRAHARALVEIARKDGFQGIDLDYESLDAADRDPYARFVEITAEETKKARLKLSIAVHPKESEPGTWGGTQAQDYRRLGAAVDVFRVMTYDFSWDTSDAGPVAPAPWVERVIRFTASVVPAKKIEVGIPGYGYNWKGKSGESIGWSDWTSLVARYGPVSIDPVSREQVLKYEDRVAFFAAAESHRPKLDLVRTMKLRGVALWRFGTEDPAWWSLARGEPRSQ
ncbi:MAG: glycosyl hydrolase family 18 protein [Fimbriimonas sp.]